MIQTAAHTLPRTGSERWWSQCLATGAAGTALLHIVYARVGTGAWETAHRWAAAMTSHPIAAHPDVCGLFRGAPAVAFALHTADHPGYRAALNTLDASINDLTRERLDRAHARIDGGLLPRLREFDLIRGLTGLGTYLLHRHNGGQLLEDVLTYLIRLTEPITMNGEVLPGWWSMDTPSGTPSPSRPGGHGNLGLAHGISGPLALLAAATRRGVTVTGQADAIGRICAWLDTWRCGADTRAWWPGTLGLAEHRTGTVRLSGPQRPSWCYGTPGLARAQQLAALATSDLVRQHDAEQALLGCVSDEAQLSQLRDNSLCHGRAGLVHTTRRVAADSLDDELTVALPTLDARLKHQLSCHPAPSQDGLLEGPEGVRLTQHSAARRTPTWDACLLLNG
ncbi:lanthionine synthetase C family protein [Streptomyces sp. ME19-01-6]|uniref:lanthionine synthetase C family protein n=1 Tax=Streptomyces sp. ME19-01-6 TaxID=3028686 RepID=UPI0029B1A341|nr:lanthionine synthetase C family protein [Streptomyces sp. ME19-01-6]MDX3224724.1 lanthionine synthetase C family protein [Streptomyces sp. ME19-01-6]